MDKEAEFALFLLEFLDPDFEKNSPNETAIEWASRWEDEQHTAFRVAEEARDIRSMFRAAHSIRNSVYEWNPSMFIVFGKTRLRSIQRKLRTYIDEWIDSGFQSDGSECPRMRNFKPPYRGGSEEAATPRPKWDSPPEAYSPPPTAISALAKLHRGKAVPFGGHYEIDIEKGTKSTIQMRIDSRGGIDYFLRQESLGSNAELRAAQIFYWFYRSGWVFSLMRCNRCRSLSVPTTKPRKRYERGWHCDKCRNSAAALAATAAKREQFREQWLALAVDAYTEFVSRPRRAAHDLSAFITERVNRDLPFSDRIKRNTITRNLKQIQARAELKGAKRNAKG